MSHYSLEQREQLATQVMGVLDDWNIREEYQISLLGLPEGTATRELTRFSRGKALPDEDVLLQRATHLIGIHQALHMVFPLNPKMPGFWLTTRNRYFRGMPLSVMLDEGVAGMDRVWRHLDCTRNWE